MTRKQDAIRAAKFEALRNRIRSGGSLNPESLSRSYGLPVQDVAGVIKEMTSGQ